MKKRLSFFQGSATDEPAEPIHPTDESAPPAELAPVGKSEAPAAPQEARAAVRDGDLRARGVHAAFTAVAQAVGSEVESLRKSMAELGTSLNRMVDGEREARAGAVDRVKQELASRIDEGLEQERKRRDGQVEVVKQAAERERQRVDEMKGALEKSIEAKIAKLSVELELLGKTLDALQIELRRQGEASAQVTALLSNVAGVFSAQQATEAVAGNESRKAVDSALPRMAE